MSFPYEFLDSGNGRKLEKFGMYVLDRPCSQAIWKPSLEKKIWSDAHAAFYREDKNYWKKNKSMQPVWRCLIAGLHCELTLTDFGHVGIFAEHATLFPWMKQKVESRKETRVLNLFAYSGLATLFLADHGASVCHLDASKKMVEWARRNAAVNNLSDAPIRWIIDDVFAFVRREIKRGRVYDAIILDPPSFGRGKSGELFKIEEGLYSLLECLPKLLSKSPAFVLLSSHTPGFTPQVKENLLRQIFCTKKVDSGEIILPCKNGLSLPAGAFARVNYEEKI